MQKFKLTLQNNNSEFAVKTQTKPKQNGFSILELTVAIFLISVILTAVAANMTKASRSLWEAKSRFYAVNMAQNCIEDFNYANKKFNWRDFYDNSLTSASGGLTEMCYLPTVSDAPMTYLCCGPAGADGSCGKARGLSAAASDNVSCEGTQITTISNDQVLGAAASRLTKAWLANRLYYDVDTNTMFNFEVRKGIGSIPYNKQTFNSAMNRYEEVIEYRQTVVVVINVTWEKYQAFQNEKNQYSVVKQYLEVY